MAEDLASEGNRLGLSDEQLENPPDRVTVVNETGLPDGEVLNAVRDVFIEEASMAWGRSTSFQNFSGTGSMLTRREYRTPTNVIDEIKLARELAERDDDVAAAIDSMIATAFSEGMENFHEDERTVGLFNGIAREANFDGAFKEFYREWLISSQLITVSLFTRDTLEWSPVDGDTREESVAMPLCGVLHAEDVRVIGDDTFGTADLAYDPPNQGLRTWLQTFFSANTSPAKKAEMGRQNRVAANMFTGVVGHDQLDYDDSYAPYNSGDLYRLNPRIVHRSTMPKGNWKYPRPLLTRNFALLEAKRLLNIMDFALLQGGSNFIVVVKKGSDTLPAQPPEISNLQNVVRAASRTGVIVGDHRLSIDVITPDLTELLNHDKRRLVGRKLAQALLRIPEHGNEDTGGAEGMKADVEIGARVVTSDRRDIKRHVERFIYTETVRRNRTLFPKGAAKLWFPKIILQGTQFFNDMVLKLRDRGDIPRKWAVEAAGFDWEAGVQQRQREMDAGDDEVMIPGVVPHSSPEAGPQDNQPGRPAGGRDDRPRQTIVRTPGETIRAYFDEQADQVVRIGDATQTIIEEFPEYAVGRMTALEREVLESEETTVRGSVIAIATNPGVRVVEERAVRLREGLSIITGCRPSDHALITKAVIFREPEYDQRQAETAVARWGFPIPDFPSESDGNPPEPEKEETAALAMPGLHLEFHSSGGRMKRVVTRGEDGEITGSIEVPVEEGE